MCSIPRRCAGQYALLLKLGGSDYAGRHLRGGGSSGAAARVGVIVPGARIRGHAHRQSQRPIGLMGRRTWNAHMTILDLALVPLVLVPAYNNNWDH